jgi:type IV secretion system protein TrbD
LSDDVPGLYAPIHRSLTERLLLGGVPPQVAGFLGMLMGILVLAWHFYALVPLLVLAWLVAAFVCRRDPYAFDVALQNRGPRRFVP